MGQGWTRIGVQQEAAALRSVLLVDPEPLALPVQNPGDHLFHAIPEREQLLKQFQAITDTYRDLGVRVHVHRPPPGASPNLLFQRDTFLSTHDGVVLARLASAQRAGEEVETQRALAQAGVPIRCLVTGRATFEGADALWIRPDHVLIGVGRRTNVLGAQQLTAVLAAQGVRVETVSLSPKVQHLLGAVNFITHTAAAVREDACSEALLRTLHLAGVWPLVLPADDEVVTGLAMNFVTLRAGEVVMPLGNPCVRSRLRAEGVVVHEIDISEYRAAAGGLGCLTGVLHRSDEE